MPGFIGAFSYPTVTPTLTPPSIPPGQSSVLSWTNTSGVVTVNGQPATSPLVVSPMATTTYVIQLTDPNGLVMTGTLTLTVTGPAIYTPPSSGGVIGGGTVLPLTFFASPQGGTAVGSQVDVSLTQIAAPAGGIALGSAADVQQITGTVTNVSGQGGIAAGAVAPFWWPAYWPNNYQPFVPPLPAATGDVVQVTPATLASAIAGWVSGRTLVLAAGTYNLTNITLNGGIIPPAGLSNIAIRGATGNPADVIIQGDAVLDPISFNGSDVWGANSGISHTGIGVLFGIHLFNPVQGMTIADMTIRNVIDTCIQIDPGSNNVLVHNCTLIDCGQQIIKSAGNPTNGVVCNNCTVEYCTIGFSTPNGAPNNYMNGIDVIGGSNWIVRNNFFQNFLTSNILNNPTNTGPLVGPVVLFWRSSATNTVPTPSNNTVIGNTFVNCQREIAFGLSGNPPDCSGGIIANNMISRPATLQHADVGIQINACPYTIVAFNTVLTRNTFQSQFQYQWSQTHDVQFVCNLSDPVSNPIFAYWGRNGAVASGVSNLTNAQESWFWNSALGNLNLLANAGAIGQGLQVPNLYVDYNGFQRPIGGSFDVGAAEFAPGVGRMVIQVAGSGGVVAGSVASLGISVSGGVVVGSVAKVVVNQGLIVQAIGGAVVGSVADAVKVGSVSGGLLVHQSDFTYLGAFRLPSPSTNTGPDNYAYADAVLALNPNSTPPYSTMFATGQNLVTYKDVNNVQWVKFVYGIAEVTLPGFPGQPALVNSPNMSLYPVAAQKQPFTLFIPSIGDNEPLNVPPNLVDNSLWNTAVGPAYFTGTIPRTKAQGNQNTGHLVIRGMCVDSVSGKLICTANIYYDGGNQAQQSHFTVTGISNLATATVNGFFQVGQAPSTQDAGYVAGHICPIPPEWQTALGMPMLVSPCPEPIITRTSPGPGATGFDPATLSISQPCPAIPYMWYSDPPAPGDGKYPYKPNPIYDGSASWRGMVFPPGTKSILFFGASSNYLDPTTVTCYGPQDGTMGVADESTGIDFNGNIVSGIVIHDIRHTGKGPHAVTTSTNPATANYIYRAIAYTVDDFIAVKNGTKLPNTILNYDAWQLTFPAPLDAANQILIGGACYDPVNNKLYVSQLESDLATNAFFYGAVIHVFKLNISAPLPQIINVSGTGGAAVGSKATTNSQTWQGRGGAVVSGFAIVNVFLANTTTINVSPAIQYQTMYGWMGQFLMTGPLSGPGTANLTDPNEIKTVMGLVSQQVQLTMGDVGTISENSTNTQNDLDSSPANAFSIDTVSDPTQWPGPSGPGTGWTGYTEANTHDKWINVIVDSVNGTTARQAGLRDYAFFNTFPNILFKTSYLGQIRDGNGVSRNQADYLNKAARECLAQWYWWHASYGEDIAYFQLGSEMLSGNVALNDNVATYAGAPGDNYAGTGKTAPTAQELADLAIACGDRFRGVGAATGHSQIMVGVTPVLTPPKFVVGAEEQVTVSRDTASTILSALNTAGKLSYAGAIAYHEYPYGSEFSQLVNMLNDAVSTTTSNENNVVEKGIPSHNEIILRAGATNSLAALRTTYALPVWMVEASHGNVTGALGGVNFPNDRDYHFLTLDGATFDSIRGRAIDIHYNVIYANISVFALQAMYQSVAVDKKNNQTFNNLTPTSALENTYKGADSAVIGDPAIPTYNITTGGYAIGHFARWIKKGDIRIDAKSAGSLPGGNSRNWPVMISAYRRGSTSLSFVIINNQASAVGLTLTLASPSVFGSGWTGEQTTSSGGNPFNLNSQNGWQSIGALSPSGNTLNISVPALSVTSLGGNFTP